MTWREGDTIVRRNIWFGRVRTATPLRVIEENERRVVLWHPAGVRERVSDVGGVPSDWHLIEHVSPNDVVVLHNRGALHSVHVAWQTGAFLCWYVNFEDEWTRSAVGYDTRDLLLDIWVEPDRNWRLLDEDEFEEATAKGVVTRAEEAAIRAEADRVIGMIERWAPPFSEGWEAFVPDRSWHRPELPEGWAA